MAGPPEFIHGTKAAHGYLKARLGDLAPDWETFRCYVTPARQANDDRGRSVPEGYPMSRRVPGKKSAVFLRKDLDNWCIRVLNAADPCRVTALRARIRAANKADAARASVNRKGRSAAS